MPELYLFQARVRLELAERRAWTAVFARNANRAKDLLEEMFGKGSVEGTPERVD